MEETKNKNQRYFFTYGVSGQPFVGGWTEVEAPGYSAARALFRIYHPDRTEGVVNCADIYLEEHMMASEMWKSGNLGSRCHERITVSRVIYDNE